MTEAHQFATLERVLSRLMLAGVLTSAVCLLAGLAVFLLGGSGRLATLILTAGLFVLMGTPVESIIDQAKTRGTDLILMGSRGRQGIRRLVLGSVTHAVLHSASGPILVFN